MRAVQSIEEAEIEGLRIVLRRKKVLYLRLSVDRRGQVSCSVPLFSRREDVEKFLRERLPWLRKKLAALRLDEQTPDPDAGPAGDRQWFFGRLYEVRTAEDITQPLFSGEFFLLPQSYSSLQKEAALKSLLQKLFTREVEIALQKWQPLLGLYARAWQLLNGKSRWGLCLPAKGLVKFNFRLVYRPRACLDYVVVHELAHLRHADHGEKFWRAVSSVLPDHKKRRQLLNNFLFLAEGQGRPLNNL